MTHQCIKPTQAARMPTRQSSGCKTRAWPSGGAATPLTSLGRASVPPWLKIRSTLPVTGIASAIGHLVFADQID